MANRRTHTQNNPSAHSTVARYGSIALIAIVVVAALSAVVAAKYLQSGAKEAAATAQEFYFESDLLDGQTHTVTATEGDGSKTATVTITLKNHADDLRYSEVDIPFAVSVSDEDGETAEDVTITSSTGTLTKGNVNDAAVTISGLQPGKTYTVTASTNETYAKTLTGAIAVTATDNSVQASLRDGGAYIEATVWTVDYSGNVTLNYAASLIPDNTDSAMSDWKTAASSADSSASSGTGAVNLDAYSSHTFRFFKSDTSKTYGVTATGTGVSINEQA